MWLSVLGVIVLLGAIVDLAWTTLGTHGGGPLSGPLTNCTWAIARRLGRGHHRLLSFAGSFILLSLMLFWVSLIWCGWLLVFSGERDSIVDVRTNAAVGWAERTYFVGSAIFTSGTAEYDPKGWAWHVLTAVCAGSGLFAITMSITYIVSVLTAMVEKRALGSFVWDMGGVPQRIIDRAWDGEKFADLQAHLNQFVVAIEIFGEQNLAYPILQFFHAENRRTAEPLRIAAMYETLLLLHFGAGTSVGPPRLLMTTSLDAIRGFAEVLADEFVKAPDDPPPPPDLEVLRALGIPTRSNEEFLDDVHNARDVRRRLLGFILKSGWTWDDVFSMELKA